MHLYKHTCTEALIHIGNFLPAAAARKCCNNFKEGKLYSCLNQLKKCCVGVVLM